MTGLNIDVVIFACYNPPAEVIERIVAVSNLVESVIVVDDGSQAPFLSLYKALGNYSNVAVVTKTANMGIAHSVNIGFVRAITAGARFVMTLDQDTIVTERLIESLNLAIDQLEHSEPNRWGVVGPGTVNGMRYQAIGAASLSKTHEIIQSAAVFNVSALDHIGLADESLVIDCVDTDLCLRLRRRGYDVYVDERIQMNHPIGSGNSIRLFGRRVSLTNHSASRRYYITRNRLVMFGRYGRSEKRWLLVSLRRLIVSTVLSLTVEQHRWDNFRATGRGIVDFLRGRSGKLLETPSLASSNDFPCDAVAVVLVTHNGMSYLREQVDSILNQVEAPEVIFLIDDHSGDGSKDFVIDYVAAQGGPPVELVENLDLDSRSDLFTRIASNFAAGLEAASSYRYIALSDQDDVWESDRLRRQRNRLLMTGALLTVGNGRIIDQSGTLTGMTLRQTFPTTCTWMSANDQSRLRAVLRGPAATGAAIMLDSRLMPRAMPIPRGWLHDRWLSLSAAALGVLDLDDHPVIRYRVYPSQAVGTQTRTNKTGLQHLTESVGKPYRAGRKLFDLSVRLRRRASDPALRRELAFRRLLRTYLANNVE